MAVTKVMVDLETLGTSPIKTPPGVIILSIGAVVFDHTAPNPILQTFYQEISIPSCREKGLKSDPDTVAWWDRQAPEARQLLYRCDAATDSCVAPLPVALERLRAFLLLQRARIIFAKGASFEFPILHAAFHAVGSKAPWNYWDEMCIRSLMQTFQSRSPTAPHNALEDARLQALWLCDRLRKYDAMQEDAQRWATNYPTMSAVQKLETKMENE